MINPVIGFAILAQALVTHSSRLVGSIVGFAITTGVLVWGLGLYWEGSAVALLGFSMTESTFLIACGVWYLLNLRGIHRAWTKSDPREGKTAQVRAWNVGRVRPADEQQYEFTYDKVQQ